MPNRRTTVTHVADSELLGAVATCLYERMEGHDYPQPTREELRAWLARSSVFAWDCCIGPALDRLETAYLEDGGADA